MPPGLFINASLPLKEFVTKIVGVAEAVYHPHESVVLHITTNVGANLNVGAVQLPSLAGHAQIQQFVQNFGDNDAATVVSANLQLQNNNPQVQIQYANNDGIVGLFTVSVNNDPNRATRALAGLTKEFKVTSYANLISPHFSEAERSALQMRERSVATLESEVNRLSSFLAELSQREAKARAEAQEQLESHYRTRQAELDDEHRKKQAALDQREQERADALKQRTIEFEERVKRFEDREAKHMRRDYLRRIEDVLAASKELRLSKGTEKKRTIVHAFSILLMMISASLATVLLYHELANQNAEWKFFIPLAASSATLVTTFVYYLKWNDRWFREHADTEFSAKRYQADILRASWIAELASEWTSEKGHELPAELIGAFTRNLFQDIGTSRESEHPMEHLTSLMKRASEITIGKGVVSVRGDAEKA